MSTTTVSTSAREAVGSACADVRDAGESDLVDGVAPAVVARPATTEQVAEVLRAAAGHGLTVVPRGHGTKLSWGMPPRSADLVVDLSAMDQVLEHAAGDLIVATQAGTRLRDLQDVVARGGQRLHLDETVPGASVGGTLAANASGPARLTAGTARDLLIGLTVVRADGVVAKAGGRVVKNVAGYDLGKLLIGSAGTLAVVTEALFRLHPLPQARRWVTVEVGGPDRAAAVVQAAVHSQVVPGAVEVEWPVVGGRPAAGRGADSVSGSVSVLLEGRQDAVDGRARTLATLLGAAATGSDTVAVGETAPEGWGAYPFGRDGERDTGLRLTFVLSGLAHVLGVAGSVGAHVRGSAGSGVVHAALPAGMPTEEVVTAVHRLRAAARRHEGHAVVVDAPPAVKQAVDLWGPVPALDLMRRVKDQFDPDHRLSPGRFVGGI